MDNMPHLIHEAMVRAIDGEVSPADRIDIQTHLAYCPECLNRYEELADLSESLNHAIETAPLASQSCSRHQLQAALDASSIAVSRKHTSVWGWGAIAAVLVLFAFLFRSRQEPASQRPIPPRQTASTMPGQARVEPRANDARQPIPVRPPVRQAGRRFTSHLPNPEAGFVRLPYSNPSLPIDSSGVIRVQLRLSALADAGVVRAMPGTGDPLIQADVLLGLDGQPSAIRILQSGKPE